MGCILGKQVIGSSDAHSKRLIVLTQAYSPPILHRSVSNTHTNPNTSRRGSFASSPIVNLNSKDSTSFHDKDMIRVIVRGSHNNPKDSYGTPNRSHRNSIEANRDQRNSFEQSKSILSRFSINQR